MVERLLGWWGFNLGVHLKPLTEKIDTQKVNLKRLKKDTLVWLASHRCEHRHNGIEHPQCFAIEKERLGFFDIESAGGGFNAQFGIMLSYCIKDGDSDTVYKDSLVKSDFTKHDSHERNGREDRRLVEHCVRDMKRFDRIVTWYGTGFDLKFTRTRAVICDVPFPSYAELKHTDLYYLVRNRFKLTSNRLENACRALLGSTDKTHVDPNIWRMAGRGDKESIGYILEHNEFDVLDLEKIYHKVIGYGRKTDNSI